MLWSSLSFVYSAKTLLLHFIFDALWDAHSDIPFASGASHLKWKFNGTGSVYAIPATIS
jgi:hypothetical protein